MHPFPIDAFAYKNRLRSMHPGEKMALAFGTIAVCLLSGSPAAALLALASLAVLTIKVAGIPARSWWYFLRVPAGFILIGVVTIAVGIAPATAPAESNSVALPLHPLDSWRLVVTGDSLEHALRLFSVSLAAVASTLFLALTTPLVDITSQLRRWGTPALFVELMTLVYRFVFVLLETGLAMYLAQEARLGYRSWRRSLHSAGMLASNLYLRSQARATAVFTALTARGYTGELRVLTPERSWSARRLLLIGLGEALLIAIALVARGRGL